MAALSALTVGALVTGLTGCSGGNPLLPGDATQDSLDANVSSRIESAVADAMALSGSTAAIVGVWKGDEAYVQGFGDGVDANSKIRAAQASQPVMCALLLDLVAKGTVSLDREVSADLPRQVGIEDITYGQLCQAQSGLADFKARIADIFANNPTRQWPEGELLAQSLARSPVSRAADSAHPSDANTLLLARALRTATGGDTSSLLHDHVFTKAGMSSTTYPQNPLTDVTEPGLMTGQTREFADGDPVCDVEAVAVPEVSPSMLSGAGATVTTVTDLKSFYEHYLNGDFGGDAASLITQTLPVSDTRDWGFGLEKVGPLYGMTGAMTGTITAAYRDPATGFSVVVALNDSTAGAGFARILAFELAAAAGANVPWSAEEQAENLSKRAVCPAG